LGIFGHYGDDGEVLTNDDLDECHGHTHEIEWDGATLEMYHYHATYEFPYTVGCFRGTTVTRFGGGGSPPPPQP
jgi:YHYH protein